MRPVPFEYLEHLVVVPVVVGGVATRFVFDSGIGLTLVRDTLGVATANGQTFTGKRMSGQEVTLPLGTVPSLAFAGGTTADLEVGILDMSSFPSALDGIGGFLSLAHFAHEPVTIDYPGRRVLVGERAEGVSLRCRVDRDGPSVAMYLPLTLPDGRAVEVEVDMGSDCLILDERFAELGAGDARRVDGTDETGHAYTRRFSTLAGRIHPTAAPELSQDDPAVMFQRIVYDGLLGTDYLRRHAVTFDVAGGTLTLGRAG